jgi:hypothetical protein
MNTFDEWWNKHRGFARSSDPTYKVYGNLAKVGVDLDKIDFLEKVFVSSEKVYRAGAAFIAQSSGAQQRVNFETWSPLRRRLQLSGIRSDNPIFDSSVHLASVKALEIAERRAIETGQVLDGAGIQRIENNFRKKGNREARELGATRRTKFLAAARKRYRLEDIFVDLIKIDHTGRPADNWGTFFVLLISEHLRRVSKTRKPYYKLSIEWIDSVRKKNGLRERPENKRTSKSGQSRIRTYKNLVPSWRKRLKTIEAAYQRTKENMSNSSRGK